MNHAPWNPHRPSCRTFRFPVLLCVALTAAMGFAFTAPAAHADQPVHTYGLTSGVVAKVLPDGALILNTGPGAPPLLSAEVVPLISSRRSRRNDTPPFISVMAEGAPGGQRGFSAQRDDDRDGLVDEDRLDGLDNDGDGRVDEDFAAISDGMVVVHRGDLPGDGRTTHLEYYHWAYPHLRGAIFLAAQGRPDLGSGGVYRLALGGQPWLETTISSDRHDIAGRTESRHLNAFVAQAVRPDRTGSRGADSACDPGARLWLGVALLDDTPGTRAVLDDGTLDLHLGERSLPVVICVAESWLQLNHLLNEAARVRAGVRDKVTGQQAPWIVPSLCARCRLAEAPAFIWRRTEAGDLQLTARILAGGWGGLDPDLFRLGGQRLGAPLEIQWRPDTGPGVTVPWQCMTAALVSRPHDHLTRPYAEMPDLLDHRSSGRLQFTFAARLDHAPEGDSEIGGTYLDGRPFTAPLVSAPVATPDPGTILVDEVLGAELLAAPVDQARLLAAGNHQLSLAPELLEGFPNPFRDLIQLRFRVPASVGEAFVWDKNEGPSAGLDLQAPVPWRRGTPNVSVKIYSINGQELVTLYEGSQGPGASTVQWSGTDSFGRQVASGAYFCKLQLDDWSVTRRLVFLR